MHLADAVLKGHIIDFSEAQIPQLRRKNEVLQKQQRNDKRSHYVARARENFVMCCHLSFFLARLIRCFSASQFSNSVTFSEVKGFSCTCMG